MPTYWTNDSEGGIVKKQVINSLPVGDLYSIDHTGVTYSYSSNKSYQIITTVVNSHSAGVSFSVETSWSDRFQYANGATVSGVSSQNGLSQSLIYYSSPGSVINSETQVTYYANGTFSKAGTLASGKNRGIINFKINEIDFKMLGFSYYKRPGYELSTNIQYSSRGWYYDKTEDTYFWFDYDKYDILNLTRDYYPVGGPNNSKKSNAGYRLNNCLYKLIPYTTYNLSFLYTNQGNFPLYIYTSYNEPNLTEASITELSAGVYIPPDDSILLATLTQSVGTYSAYEYEIPVNFYGLTGFKYLLFVGGFSGGFSSTYSGTYSAIYLKNVSVSGGYYSGNNREYSMYNYSTYSTTEYGLTGATYTAYIGFGNTINATSSLENPGISLISSKIGNGAFTAGIWENGIWNSGSRIDDAMCEFYDIYQFFSYRESKRYRLQLIGPSSSVCDFEIGDNVAISNIVAIDINENRKILKGYYTIINKSDNSIIVEFDSNFPLRRVERDSVYHRIYISKNIWLSGGFLNGYFKGIWNYGLFKGYPLITEMYNSHWIDGVLDGGHFYSEKYTIPNFTDTVFSSGKVGLTFSTPHGLTTGDVITINKDDKTINAGYDGDHIVTSVVNDYQIVIDQDWLSDSTNESGAITVYLNTGLVQKIDFKSNNRSTTTIIESLESDAIFLYDSWMDVIYDDSSATNIGKPQTKLNTLSNRTYSENNLYGWITNDVLDSVSSFRDSFSTSIRNYKLGTKYKVFSDFIGDAGMFQEEFSTESKFIKYGWTFSKFGTYSVTFSRTDSTSTYGEELKVQVVDMGGILDITPVPDIEVANRTEEDIQKSRYTKVEFDLLYSSNTGGLYLDVHKDDSKNKYILSIPTIHFNNLNTIDSEVIFSGQTYSILIDADYLPIYKNVNHVLSLNKTKAEYFYNKRNLAMNFLGYSNFSSISENTNEFIIDNLHFYEVDMIPFFQYFTEDNINKGVVVPYQAIAPYIDYENSSFNFIDNISLGLDSITTVNSYVPVSGVGIGIGTSTGAYAINSAILYATASNRVSNL